MALGKIRKHNGSFVPPKLQITSMMDMFTIILIFLLFSFSSKPEVTGLDKHMELPASTAKMDHTENHKTGFIHFSTETGRQGYCRYRG